MKIRMLKPVVVRDRNDRVIEHLRVGDVVECTMDCVHYWNACPPIFKDEAELIEEPIDESRIQLSNN